MRLSVIIILFVVAGVGVFALQNQTTLQVRFLKFLWETSQSVVIMISFLIGLLGGILAMVPGSIKRWRKIRSLEKTVATMEKNQDIPLEE